jgi:serine/threonine protein kinase
MWLNKLMREQHSFAKEQLDSQPGWQSSGEKPNNAMPSALHRFGNYDLVQRIGIGGMGEVYLARQRTAFGREVAVKIIRSDLMHDITIRKRFLREAEVNAYLKHDHILPLVEFGEENGRLFLVTPYIQGGTLSRRLRGGAALSLAETHQLFTALVEAVAYLHKRGVIHRDLKPSNILLDHEEDSQRVYVRLIDFGIASLQGQAASAPLTAGGNEMGTEAYMAPERLRGIAAPSNDIYSLGLILYQMLTGKLPEDDVDSMLPEPLIEVVQQCTVSDPGMRYASAEELVKAFERAYQSLSLSHFRVTASNPQLPLPPVGHNISTRMPLATPQRQPSSLDPVTPMSNEHPSRPSIAPLTDRKAEALPNTPSIPPLESKSYPSQPSHSVRLRSEIVLPPLADRTSPFKGEDYGAPTSYLSPQRLQKSSATAEPNTSAGQPGKVVPRPKQQKRGVPIITIISVIIIVIVFVIGALGYSIYQSLDTATITVTPRLQTVSTILNLTAKMNQMNVDSNAGIIPAGVVSSTKSAFQRGNTSGCSVPFLCRNTVSEDDFHNLVVQIRPGLRSQIAQDISQQEQTQGLTPVGDIIYGNETDTSSPPVGTASDTVTVTVSLQGKQEYIKASDAQTVAKQKIRGQLKPNYTLIDTTLKISSPVVQSVDKQGNAQIKVVAAAFSIYTLTQSDITKLAKQIAGKSQQDARAIIRQDPNLDPQNIRIDVTYGGNLPGDGQQITINQKNPSSIPPVQLPTGT